MNLVAIEHDKCDQYSKTDYYVVPDGKRAEDVQRDIDAAQKAYFKARSDFEAAWPKPETEDFNPQWGLSTTTFPDDMTIGEAKRLAKESASRAETWREQRDLAAGSFQLHMRSLGYMELYSAEAKAKMFTASADWGHHHGEKLRF